MRIQRAIKADFNNLIEIWEASIRATHDFLSDENINELRPLILHTYLPMLTVYKATDDKNEIEGFMGVAQHRIEMLFISPDSRGKGIGKTLLNFGITELGINELDVNEQNIQAVDFYLHQGFNVFNRSEVDGQGNPFPLLHMRKQA
ncbi:GCN5 family acetyltransferase [Photorhabdus temperata]|uniref:GNAT family N-acetyltransferase n=3 Tax=Photorhabdus TaxID=29487 RepID=A0A7X5QM26_9GAMM|nr:MULTISPECIES: GNAT family N-acetyltransferase [Photorhabdus]ETS33383.1 acetyltransferase [Photorhabdus khanii NC19]MQL47745.1 GNAT family N-acetyltransferase [Photorhabdus khanii]NHB96714.1 GNAT family N-acetyltransferase [Photorhabdus stackebrandtii]OHV53910.1 GCN5 family acetyltransferase [Photorhabdus temperata]